MNSSNGDWHDLIEEFNKYEEKNFDSGKNTSQISWWHLVRYKVITEILIKKKLYIPIENIPVKNSLKRNLNHIFKLFLEIFIIINSRNKKVQSLYFFTRKVEYFDKLISSEKKTGLIISREMKDYGNNIFISYRTITILAKMIKSFVFISKNLKEEINEISKEIMSRYNTDVYKLIKDKYKTEIGFYYAWKIVLLNSPNLNKVFFMSNDSNYSLVHLANNLKIETIEVQHGYMGSTNYMYSLPKVNLNLSTLPNRFIITEYTNDITYPVNKILIKENLNDFDKKPVEKNIDILIGSGLNYFKETIEVSNAFSNKKFRLCVKLHPSQIDYEYYRKLIPLSIKIYPGDYDIKKILKRSKIFIPMFSMSSTIFTASKFKNIIIYYRFMKMKPSKLFDELVNYKVDSIEELVSEVEYLLNKYQFK